MMPFLERASLVLIHAAISSAVRSFALAGVAAAALAAFRPRATSFRLFAWTSVLYTSLALPLLRPVLPPVKVPIPQFLTARMTYSGFSGARSLEDSLTLPTSPARNQGDRKPASRHETVPSQELVVPGTKNSFSQNGIIAPPALSWNLMAATIYLPVALFFLARFVAGIVWSSRLVRNSELIAEPFVMARATSLAGRHAPRLAASAYISVPLTVGVLRPAILLPSDWRGWDVQKLEAVLAHELAHVARRDALTQRMAQLYRTIFWFHPLAWWLNRHLATLAEQASDEAALSSGADQKRYARTLLDFFDALRTSPGRVRWQGVSMARVGQAEQRLERILAWKGTITMHVKRPLAAAIIVLALPLVYLAASVRASSLSPAALTADASQQPPAPSAPAAPPVGSVSTVAPITGVPSVAPAAPVTPVDPVDPVAAPVPPAPEGEGSGMGKYHSYGSGFSYAYGFDDEERFVIVSGKSGAVTMSGSTQDARHVERLKKQISGDFIWLQRDEKSYIIRDQATVDRARALWAPQQELGKKQEELGKQQEVLGKQQEELGARMQQVRVDVPDMTAELDRLKAKLQKLGPTATMEQIGELQSEIGELQSKMGESQSRAGDQQSKLGALQGQLGEKQGKLGEQQGELGRQQAELAEKATRQMKELIDDAIKNGIATPEEEIVRSPTL
jgi:beta-lactamase regulating signal transducer with metallopeptidase domain